MTLPKSHPSRRRDVYVKTRVTERESDAINAAAARAEMTRAEFLRVAAKEKIAREKEGK